MRLDRELKEIESTEAELDIIDAPESIGDKALEVYERVSDRVLPDGEFCGECPFICDDSKCILTGDVLDTEDYGINLLRTDECLKWFGGDWDDD